MPHAPLDAVTPPPTRVAAALGLGFRRRRTSALAALVGCLLATAASQVRAQDLVGCRLVEATLQCLPGVDATPQQQIQILKGEIGADLQQEAMVEQRIDGLRQVVLAGEAMEGSLVRAQLATDSGANLGTVTYHWYRLAPGRNRWELIPDAQGDSYTVSRNDIAYELMVVVVVTTPDGTRRSQSAPVGPVRVLNPLASP
ncbi:hypothetical protein NZK32_12525 [Cyanobium sp. FGCU-52]|nr:hypothetical protein [Cyanobium sp. FGCU52]